MRCRATLLVIVLATAIGAAEKGAESLQGTWKLTAGEADGKALPEKDLKDGADGKALPEKDLKDGKLVLKGDGYAVTLAGKTITGKQKTGPDEGAQDDRHHG